LKLFVDENLSRRPPDLLGADFKGSVSVAGLDLLATPDDEIWRFAGDRGYVIITKDRDFVDLSALYGPPLKVIRVLLPNGSTQAVVQLVRESRELIDAFAASPTAGILYLP